MPKSPFYIDPGFDYTRGLKGLQAGLEFKQLRIEREKARADGLPSSYYFSALLIFRSKII